MRVSTYIFFSVNRQAFATLIWQPPEVTAEVSRTVVEMPKTLKKVSCSTTEVFRNGAPSPGHFIPKLQDFLHERHGHELTLLSPLLPERNETRPNKLVASKWGQIAPATQRCSNVAEVVSRLLPELPPLAVGCAEALLAAGNEVRRVSPARRQGTIGKPMPENAARQARRLAPFTGLRLPGLAESFWRCPSVARR